ncbi:MFS transporter [Bacillus sp. 28A-2]|uniref:MFS transporter n=1 Tax=Bacillus sp. 28A-2 TaxID=2772252 RepID=UPI00168CD75B|nr:MFS transporter [Bacillus sp. 28A-2]MBD3861613.1 MFS transporter [Bacillus sp. 28A-2]
MKKSTLMLSRLGTMIFFQEFVYGTWLVSMGLILSKHGLSSIIGTAYAVGGLAAIITPIFVGMLTDRFFSSQKALAFCNIVGGVILWFIPSQIYNGNASIFLMLIFLYNLMFIPSYSLRNNISFRNIENSEKHFPIVNVFGTIGFIASGLLLGFLGYSSSPISFQMGSVVSIFLGIYNLTLPSTPPLAKGKKISMRDLLFLDAFALFKRKNYLIFIICTVFLFIPFTAYSSYTSVFLESFGFNKVSAIMTIGQASEVLFLILLPLFFYKLGYKYIFLIGLVSWVLRFVLFAIGANEMMPFLLYLGIALHGLCWNFFFVSGFMYTDEIADTSIKSQAQGLLMLFSQGIGVFLGSLVTAALFKNNITKSGFESLNEWNHFWTITAVFTMIITILFFVLFKREKSIRIVKEQKVNTHV